MRKKLAEEKHRKSFSVTIDQSLIDLLEEFFKEKNIKNKSRYIENLIRKDMSNKGEDVKKEF